MKKTIPLITLAGMTISQAAIFSSGELDFGVILEGGELELEAHVVSGIVDDTQTDDVEFEVSQIQVLTGADREFTADASHVPAGFVSGSSLWILPQSEVVGVPFVALASEELTPSDWSSAITFTLGTVTSPSGNGTFAMWTFDALDNPTFHFSSSEPTATDNNNQFVSNFSHDHVNWGFDEAGTWSIELTASGNLADSSLVSTTETLTFIVIPEPSTALLAGISLLGFAARRRRS